MKALKEKRISLRSLWRRGLVILSLFALVFASCSDSSSGGGDSGGPRVVGFEITKGPANNQYLGREVDLTGMEMMVYYSDGTRKPATYEDNKSKITTNPRVVSGWDYSKPNGELVFDDTIEYDVIFSGVFAAKPLLFGGTAAGRIKVYPIITSLYLTEWGYSWDNMGVWGDSDLGLHLTGAASLADKEYYVDDETFDFSGLTLEADYLLNYEDVIKSLRNDFTRDETVTPPQIKRLPVKFSDVTWEIRPRYEEGVRYDSGKPTDESFDGYVFVTVGQDSRYDSVGNMGWQWVTNYGLSTLVPIGKVHTVKNLNAIELLVSDEIRKDISEYMFWEENTKAKWLDKLGDAAQLKVTYSNNTTKTLDIKDLKEKYRIYLNSNPQQGYDDYWTEEGWYRGPSDFDIMTIRYPITKKSVDLGIILYYRGAQYPIKVDVFTTLVSVTADPSKDFWPNPTWDNDVDNGARGPQELAKLLTVTAKYQAVNDASKQKDVPLTYYWSKPSTDTRRYGDGPFYLFAKSENVNDYRDAYYVWDPDDPGIPEPAFDEDGEYFEDRDGYVTYSGDSTYAKGYQKYLKNLLKGKETTTNITIRHSAYVKSIVNDFYDKWATADDPEFYFGDETYAAPAKYIAGILPNNQNFYLASATKPQWLTAGRNFGPKVSQTKKYKTSIHWIKGPIE